MKIIVLALLVAVAFSSVLTTQNHLRQDYKFNAWSLECTNKCQTLGGVVCGYSTQVCCRSVSRSAYTLGAMP